MVRASLSCCVQGKPRLEMRTSLSACHGLRCTPPSMRARQAGPEQLATSALPGRVRGGCVDAIRLA